jgi:histone acetyltransferase (RNA polymerase elongator complex component)
MYKEGEYKPLELQEAIAWSKVLVQVFEQGNTKILKLGLHPSDGLLSGDDLVAGPFHRSFRELVMTEIWTDILSPLFEEKGDTLELLVPKSELNFAVGYQGANRKMLEAKFKKVKFRIDEKLEGRKYKLDMY